MDVAPEAYDPAVPFAPVSICNGTATLDGATLTLASNGTFALALTLNGGQPYQETGTFKVAADGTITFKSSGQTVQAQLVNGMIFIQSYTYCSEQHSLLFARVSA